MTPEILSQKLPEILNNFQDIVLVYLFGSQVSKKTGPMSDYDLAILDERQKGGVELQAAFQSAISHILGIDRVDVVLLNRAPIELAFEVISTGKVLYQKDLYTRVEYEANVMSLYSDYLPYLQAYNQMILQGDPHGKRVQRYRETLRRTQRTLGPAGGVKGENAG